MEGAFSVKSDTYSFGVLLLEIVSGLKISSPNLIIGFPNLIVYVSIGGFSQSRTTTYFLPTEIIAHRKIRLCAGMEPVEGWQHRRFGGLIC
jgi:hypothetical protein